MSKDGGMVGGDVCRGGVGGTLCLRSAALGWARGVSDRGVRGQWNCCAAGECRCAVACSRSGRSSVLTLVVGARGRGRSASDVMSGHSGTGAAGDLGRATIGGKHGGARGRQGVSTSIASTRASQAIGAKSNSTGVARNQ